MGEMFREVFERDFTYAEGFRRVVRKFPNKEAMIDPHADKTWTYSQLNGEANRLANALAKAGVTKGDLVMYQLLNCPEFVFSYLAPPKLGAITNPANFNFSPAETTVCLNSSRPKVYLYDESLKDIVVKALSASSHKPETVIMVGEGEVPQGHIAFADFVKNQPTGEPETDYVPHIYDEVARLFTSGTTGQPKGVPLYNANEVMSCHDVAMHFPLNPTDVTMNTTPWFHRGGIHSGGPAPTFFAGG